MKEHNEKKEHNENSEQLQSIAEEVLKLSRNTLLVNLRFLDEALSKFSYHPHDDSTYFTNGEYLIYNPVHTLKTYKGDKNAPVRDYLHIVMHCIFRHMFMNPNINRPYWDLACDIAVEAVIDGLGLKITETKKSSALRQELEKIKVKVKTLTAEKLYAYLQDELTEAQAALLRGYFYADNHEIWYMTNDEVVSTFGTGDGKSDNNNGDGNSDAGKMPSSLSRGELDELWQNISERMQTDLETFSKEQGDKAGTMMQNLNAVNREKYDYTAFLKKFAVLGETMKINDDEFDYIFYTYGLEMYEKMPLIEPLEYKDEKRIREFIIAIDTSGSTSGELVQTFLQKTYNILKSTESFFSKINLHIIQCDAEIQEHVKITNQDEFDEYLKTMKIRGLGGTDFRPVFELTQKLINEKEFINLKGLIYFTDGYGTFPEKMPSYDTAFVFVDDAYNNPNVPPWAIKLVLEKDEI